MGGKAWIWLGCVFTQPTILKLTDVFTIRLVLSPLTTLFPTLHYLQKSPETGITAAFEKIRIAIYDTCVVEWVSVKSVNHLTQFYSPKESYKTCSLFFLSFSLFLWFSIPFTTSFYYFYLIAHYLKPLPQLLHYQFLKLQGQSRCLK